MECQEPPEAYNTIFRLLETMKAEAGPQDTSENCSKACEMRSREKLLPGRAIKAVNQANG